MRKKTDNNKNLEENKNEKKEEPQQKENISFLQKLFSVKNSGNKKVIRIFGLKITLKKGNNKEKLWKNDIFIYRNIKNRFKIYKI